MPRLCNTWENIMRHSLSLSMEHSWCMCNVTTSSDDAWLSSSAQGYLLLNVRLGDAPLYHRQQLWGRRTTMPSATLCSPGKWVSLPGRT